MRGIAGEKTFHLSCVHLAGGISERVRIEDGKEDIMRKLFLLPLLAFLFAMVIGEAGISHAAGPSGYHLVKTVPISAEEGWDYIFVDSEARRVYVSHGSHVVVMNADTYAIEGDIAETPGVHGIAIARDLGRGFISAGRANTAVIFDLKSLKRLGTVKTDANPDAIIY